MGDNWYLKAAILLGIVFSILTVPGRVFAQASDSGQLTVSATVPPPANSISLTITSPNPTAGNVSQDTTINYQISYTSTNASTSPITLQAEWGLGTINGALSPSVNIVDYVPGSASNAYGSTPPVIDTQNRTITWTISAFPPGTDSVSFQLKTNTNYTGDNSVSFPVTARTLLPTGVPDDTITRTYVYSKPADSGSGSSESSSDSGSSSSSSSSSSTSTIASPSPSSNSSSPKVQQVTVTDLSASSASVEVDLTARSALALFLGTSLTNLTTQIPSDTTGRVHFFTINKLLPNTQYYFQVQLPNQKLGTEIYTFKTASQDVAIEEPVSLLISNQQNVLFNHFYAEGESAMPLIVTKNAVVDIAVTLPKSEQLKTAKVVVRGQKVLGATSDDQLQANETLLSQLSETYYVGKLRVPMDSGNYDLVLQTTDNKGNFHERKIGEILVVNPFTVKDSITHEPVIQAKVVLSRYNQLTKLYELISNSSIAPNPVYTNEEGTVDINLYPAMYRAEVSIRGYKSQTVEFKVSDESQTVFPEVALVPTGTGWLFFVDQYWHYALSLVVLGFEKLAEFAHFWSFYRANLILLIAGAVGEIISSLILLAAHLQHSKKSSINGLGLFFYAGALQLTFFAAAIMGVSSLSLAIVFGQALGFVASLPYVFLSTFFWASWTFNLRYFANHLMNQKS